MYFIIFLLCLCFSQGIFAATITKIKGNRIYVQKIQNELEKWDEVNIVTNDEDELTFEVQRITKKGAWLKGDASFLKVGMKVDIEKIDDSEIHYSKPIITRYNWNFEALLGSHNLKSTEESEEDSIDNFASYFELRALYKINDSFSLGPHLRNSKLEKSFVEPTFGYKISASVDFNTIGLSLCACYELENVRFYGIYGFSPTGSISATLAIESQSEREEISNDLSAKIMQHTFATGVDWLIKNQFIIGIEYEAYGLIVVEDGENIESSGLSLHLGYAI